MILLERLAEVVAELLADDERRVLLGEDVRDGGMLGLSRVAASDERFASRLLGAPLCPATGLAHAAGLALGGALPIVLLPSVGALLEGLAGLREAALLHWRLDVPVPLLVVAPCGPGFGLGGDVVDDPEATLARIPFLRVLALGSVAEGPALLRAAAAPGELATVLLLPRRLCLAEFDAAHEDASLTHAVGAAVTVRDGTRATVFTWGECVELCREAIERSDLDVALVNLEGLAPLPHDRLLELAQATGKLVIVHSGPRDHGLGAELAARFGDEAVLHLDAPILRVTGRPGPYLPEHESDALPELASILAAIHRVVHD